MQLLYKNSKLGNFCYFNHPEAEVRWAGPEQILTGYKQVPAGFVQVGEDEQGQPILDESQPIYEDGDPIYEDGADLFSVEWDEAWGEPPTEEDLAAWEAPPPEPSPVTDVERVKKQVNEEIGPLVDQRKAIIVDCRDEAAAIMLLKGYGYEGDEAIMRARVMAAGSQLYEDYAPEIKAFEDGASSQFYKSLEKATFDFLDLEYQDSNESAPTTIRSRLRAKMLPYLNPLSL